MDDRISQKVRVEMSLDSLAPSFRAIFRKKVNDFVASENLRMGMISFKRRLLKLLITSQKLTCAISVANVLVEGDHNNLETTSLKTLNL